VRETGTFTLADGVAQAQQRSGAQVPHSGRGEIKAGSAADLLLFDPAKVGISGLRKQKDLPGGGTRMLRDPLGVHGVWVNGVQVHDGKGYIAMDTGTGEGPDGIHLGGIRHEGFENSFVRRGRGAGRRGCHRATGGLHAHRAGRTRT